MQQPSSAQIERTMEHLRQMTGERPIELNFTPANGWYAFFETELAAFRCFYQYRRNPLSYVADKREMGGWCVFVHVPMLDRLIPII
jgi:hypothetical protein